MKNVGLGDALLQFMPSPPDDSSSSCHIYSLPSFAAYLVKD